MLTMPPGPDIAPHNDWPIAILERTAWADWLSPAALAQSLIQPLPPWTQNAKQVGQSPSPIVRVSGISAA